jgi:hypothetical protein
MTQFTEEITEQDLEVIPLAKFRFGAIAVLGAWITGRFVVTFVSSIGFWDFSNRNWIRWDSFNYLSISAHGRTFGACGTPGYPAIFGAGHWCGTAGWLPGYPLAIRIVSGLGIPAKTASLLLPAAFLIGTLGVVWYGWARDLSLWRSYFLLVIVAVFPGAIYNYAAYPTALALLGLVIAILAASRGHFATMGIAAAIAVISYSTATFVVVGLVAAIVAVGWTVSRREALKRAAWGSLAFVPLAILSIHDAVVFGHWNAFELVQSQDRKQFELPGTQLYDFIVHRTTTVQLLVGPHGAIVMAVQAALAGGLVLAACVVGFRRWFRSERSLLDLYPAAAGASALVLMSSSGVGSIWHRGIVLAAPCVVGFRRLPTWVLIALALVISVVTSLMSTYFFKNTLA